MMSLYAHSMVILYSYILAAAFSHSGKLNKHEAIVSEWLSVLIKQHKQLLD